MSRPTSKHHVPNPEPRSWPTKAPLGDANLGDFVLVPLDPRVHAKELWEASQVGADPQGIWEFMPYGPFQDSAALERVYSSQASPKDPHFYCLLGPDGRPIGVLSYLNIEPEHGCLEIGHIWYAVPWQRTEANTLACFLLLREAFDGMGYRRVEWKCDARNERSQRAALRLGFQREGLFRQHRIVRGLNRDSAWFSMLDGEWPERRDLLERWLCWEGPSGSRPSLGGWMAELSS